MQLRMSSGNQTQEMTLGELAANTDVNENTVVSAGRSNVNSFSERVANKIDEYLRLLVLVTIVVLLAYFDPVQFLFTDGEFWGTHVSSGAKCGVFLIVLLIVLYYFRKSKIKLLVIWIFLLFVVASFAVHVALGASVPKYNNVTITLTCLISCVVGGLAVLIFCIKL